MYCLWWPVIDCLPLQMLTWPDNSNFIARITCYLQRASLIILYDYRGALWQCNEHCINMQAVKSINKWFKFLARYNISLKVRSKLNLTLLSAAGGNSLVSVFIPPPLNVWVVGRSLTTNTQTIYWHITHQHSDTGVHLLFTYGFVTKEGLRVIQHDSPFAMIGLNWKADANGTVVVSLVRDGRPSSVGGQTVRLWIKIEWLLYDLITTQCWS